MTQQMYVSRALSSRAAAQISIVLAKEAVQ
jgi:hypothetical protein